MLSAITFTIKLIIAVFFVVLLSFGRNKLIPREEVGIYILLSISIAAITVISQQLSIQFLISAAFFVISIITYSLNKDNGILKTVEKVTPLWIVMILGVCAGSLMLLQGLLLVFIAYYILNYFPSLIKRS